MWISPRRYEGPGNVRARRGDRSFRPVVGDLEMRLMMAGEAFQPAAYEQYMPGPINQVLADPAAVAPAVADSAPSPGPSWDLIPPPASAPAPGPNSPYPPDPYPADPGTPDDGNGDPPTDPIPFPTPGPVGPAIA